MLVSVNTTAGGVKCWGGNNLYSVGDGTRTDRLVPTNVLGLTTGVSALATGGGNHTCALLNTSMKCWGANAYGQLRNGLTTNSGTPVEVQAPRPEAADRRFGLFLPGA